MARCTEIRFTSAAGCVLSGAILEPETDTPSGAGVVFVHGLWSDQSGGRARAAVVVDHLKTTAIAFDLSAHGESEGNAHEIQPFDHVLDVCAAMDLLVRDGEVSEERIGLCGSSYGSYIAGWVPAERPTRSLLLRAPALHDDAVMSRSIAELTPTTADVNAAEFFGRLEAYEGSALVLESELDEVIPTAVVRAYLCHLKHAEHRIIPGAGHRLSAAPEYEAIFGQESVRWFAGL